MSSQTALGTTDLTGKMLIAMPGMGDPRFEHALIFMCDHSDEGAMGVIVNKPSADVDMNTLLSQLSIEIAPGVAPGAVHFGGPVEMGRGFVLHSPDFSSDVTTLNVLDDICMTATLDVLEELGAGTGPSKWLMALGYSGWGPGQLEDELAQNGWLVCDASPRLIFDVPDIEKWEASLETLGVAALALSAEGGRA